MADISYKTGIIPDKESLEILYQDAGWSIYCEDLDKLLKAFQNSCDIITAWQGEKLVGLVRTVGDGETILYIQDLLVLKEFRRQGIGSSLLGKVVENYPGVRQKVLLTDDTRETRRFYQAADFRKAAELDLLCYVRMT